MDASLEGLPIKEILEIARRNGATSVSVFGSRARGDARPDSDLDLLIEIAPRTTLMDLGRMHAELNDLLDIAVDVVTVGSLRARVRDEILRDAKPLVSPRSARQRLEDILRAVDKIIAFTARGFPDTEDDDPLWDSIVHNITIIGEAIKSLPPSVRGLSTEVEWSDIVRMRDFIVHRYFEIEHLVLRNTVEEDLPKLRVAIEALLAKADPEDAVDGPDG